MFLLGALAQRHLHALQTLERLADFVLRTDRHRVRVITLLDLTEHGHCMVQRLPEGTREQERQQAGHRHRGQGERDQRGSGALIRGGHLLRFHVDLRPLVLTQLLQGRDDRQLRGPRALQQGILRGLDVARLDLLQKVLVERLESIARIQCRLQQGLAFRRLDGGRHLFGVLRSLLGQVSDFGYFALDLRLVVHDEHVARMAHRL